MRKIWVIPAVVLAALLLLGLFRYAEVASKTTDSRVYKWKLDRWTGITWQIEYPTRGDVQESVVNPDSLSTKDGREYKASMTNLWISSLIIASLWLIVGIAWPRSKTKLHPRLKRWSSHDS